ncbi:polysulfide reductase NrfD [Streptomyces sp. NBC_00728]
MKVSSLTAVSLSAAALIHDLGRPGRFANMLRVFKPTSPMSMGSWLLSAYGPAAGAAALSAVTGRRWPRTQRSSPPTPPFPPGTAPTGNFPICSRRPRRSPPREWRCSWHRRARTVRPASRRSSLPRRRARRARRPSDAWAWWPRPGAKDARARSCGPPVS